MHGCGKKWYPGGAIEEGEWVDDNFVGDYGTCNAAQSLATAATAESVAAQARDFMFKPDGDVSYKLGLELHQSPFLYTAGTEYLMPGPAGNKYSMPNDAGVRRALVAQARRALAIYQSVNFPRPPPDMIEEEPPPAAPVRPAPGAPPPLPVENDEDEDELDEDELDLPPPPPRAAPGPRRPASLTLSLGRGQVDLGRAFCSWGKALRLRRLAE